MSIRNLLFPAALLVISFKTCFSINIVSAADIEGLWISTEETSSLFEPWAQRVALLIEKDSTQIITARGYFLKNCESIAEWEFINVQYDNSKNRISFLDSDLDTLICILDYRNEILKGEVHSHNNINTLNFIRADRNLEIRLFYPRVPDKNGKIIYCCNKPEQFEDGLSTESIYNSSIDSSSISKLMKNIIEQKYGRLKSILIIKDGKLILEEYFYGYNRDDLQQIRSCTKSITSLMFGISLDHHKDIDIEQSVFDFFPEYNSLKSGGREEIKLKNILTMTAGLEWDDYPAEMFKTDDCYRYILSKPMVCKPGEKFNYNSGCSVLLGGIINFLEAQNTLDFAEEFLFTPLAITNYIWESHNNGILRCGEGLSLRPRDMAKIGLLVLNDGKWQSKQIVPKDWIRESTAPHVQESLFFDYGYQWWHHSKNNLQWWTEPNSASPDEPDLITALGYAGQYIMIIRDLNLVIVTTASDFGDGAIARSKISMAVKEIIPIFLK